MSILEAPVVFGVRSTAATVAVTLIILHHKSFFQAKF